MTQPVDIVWEHHSGGQYSAETTVGRWRISDVGGARASYILPETMPFLDALVQAHQHERGSLAWRQIWHQVTPQSEVVYSDLGTFYLSEVITHFINGPAGDLLETMAELGFREQSSHDYDHGTLVIYNKPISKGHVAIHLHSSGTFAVEYESVSSPRAHILVSTRANEDTIWPDGCDPRAKLATLLPSILLKVQATHFGRKRAGVR